MAIGQKTQKPTAREEREAYELSNLRDGGTCLFKAWDCAGGVQMDHRQNRMPGNTIVSNLQALCMVHHKWKTEHPREAIEQGWGMPRHTLLLPSEWPAARWFRGDHGIFTRGFVLYDDEGRFREITAEEAARITDGMVA